MLYSDRGKTVKSALSELAIGDYMGTSLFTSTEIS